MNSYVIFEVLHILAAFALVGPLMLLPKWLHLMHHDAGRLALHDLHRLTGIAGWLVLLFGSIMLILQNGAMLSALWMQLSIVIFILVQIFDHFWADRREEELEKKPQKSTSSLKVWLIVKLGLYCLITVLMVIKLP